MMRFFFPVQDRSSLSVSLQKRLPILINANMLLFVYFLAATFIRYRGDPAGTRSFLIAVIATDVLYPISLALVKGRRYGAAAWVSTFAMFLNVLWIGVLLPITGAADVYRFTLYLVGSGVANSLVAINRKQIATYSIVSVSAFIICLFLVYAPALPDELAALKMISTTTLLLAIAIDLCLILSERLSIGLVVIAEDGLSANERKAAALSLVLQRAAENLRIGDELVGAAERAKGNGQEIRASIDSIRQDSMGLAADAKAVDAVYTGIIGKADDMRSGVTEQNASLAMTSEAISKILTTISALAEIARSKKAALDEAVKKLSDQHGKAREIADGIDSIGKASKNVLGVASGIMDISEKTNMLAMNASIEAAHAGSAGKGFSVLAMEIRKLSEESRINTTAIGEALARNGDVVKGASKTIDRFVAELAVLNGTVAGAFDAMGEIIDGLGNISASARQLSSATDEMVATSNAVSRDVIAVSGEIQNSGGRVAHITEFASVVEAKVVKTAAAFSTIERELERVAEIGKANVENVEALDAQLRAVRKN
ncbi:MAG: hypothetical protein A2Y38_09390 [Spirochaetes bacterium GWB1_59_5]|nr:MAG: hypothetical protein A2Y38_09390 [Spirochaetes bacterium GWB1_59_5]